MIKRYSFKDEAQAKELIEQLLPTDSKIEWNQLTVSEFTDGLVVWGFEDKQKPILDEDGIQTFDEKGLLLFDTIKGTTFNIDVYWKYEQPDEWKEFEIFPKSPSHY